jgi:hypothetical protein
VARWPHHRRLGGFGTRPAAARARVATADRRPRAGRTWSTPFCAGYREHVRLTEDELGRLPGILNLRPLWLACLDLRMTVEAGGAPTMDGGWLHPAAPSTPSGWPPRRLR